MLGGFVSGLEYAGLRGIAVDQPTPRLEGLPHLAFVAFQMTFAAVTLAILTGALAERVRLGAFLVLGLLWTTLVYDPVAR